MDDRIRSIEDRLERVEARVADLAERVRVLAQQEAPSSSRVVPLGEEAAPAEPGPWSFHRLPIQVGRLFLVMAGAFGLRAVTLSEAVLDWLGVGIGLAYAAVWVGVTDVAGRKGRASDAAFFAAAVVATGVLVAVSLFASGMVRVGERPEWRWTAVALIAGVACKVAAQDVPRGRPTTLFLSLALVGGALLGATRLMRRGS